MRLRWLAIVLGALLSVGGVAQNALTIMDMDTVKHKPTEVGEDKKAAGTVELAPGKIGQACRFSFIDDARSGFFTAWVNATPEWDKAAGISFWVQGDGSQSWGGLELIDGENYSLRYGYCFPIDSKEWRKIAVPWRDLVPELPAAALMDPQAGYKPSSLRNVWFGKWWYWQTYPAHSYAIDEIALESTIDVDTTDYTPAGSGLARTVAKLEAGEPVTIVTMGDSLSAKEHWANREVLWSSLLAEKLKAQYGSEVSVINAAIGGTTLNANLVLMPRWLAATPKPDLVTVWFGYNDWDAGMRGEHFREMLGYAVGRIRRMTGGASDVLLLTTCPALKRWGEMAELAEAARTVAAEKRTGLADMDAAFHKAGADETARTQLYAWDATHLGGAGHELAAETVRAALEE
jgi:lysophospholipase L1-like esterase